MRRLVHQYTGAGVLFLIGLGVELMPGVAAWWPAGTIWGIAFVWLAYRIKQRKTVHLPPEQLGPLADIKSDLVNMNTIERETATKKAKQPCDNKTAIQIRDDFFTLFDMNIDTFGQSLMGEVLTKHDVEPIIDFYKKIGDILDANDYGLKTELENHESYQQARLDLAKTRVTLREPEKRNAKIQTNIDRVRSLSYGLNSCILLRGILHSAPELREQIPAIVRVTLESVETIAEKVLSEMVNNLEGKQKAKPTQEQIQDMIEKVTKMQSDSRLRQTGEMQNEHTND